MGNPIPMTRIRPMIHLVTMVQMKMRTRMTPMISLVTRTQTKMKTNLTRRTIRHGDAGKETREGKQAKKARALAVNFGGAMIKRSFDRRRGKLQATLQG